MRLKIGQPLGRRGRRRSSVRSGAPMQMLFVLARSGLIVIKHNARCLRSPAGGRTFLCLLSAAGSPERRTSRKGSWAATAYCPGDRGRGGRCGDLARPRAPHRDASRRARDPPAGGFGHRLAAVPTDPKGSRCSAGARKHAGARERLLRIRDGSDHQHRREPAHRHVQRGGRACLPLAACRRARAAARHADSPADLRPLALDDPELSAAVESLVHDFERRSGIRCKLALNDAGHDVPAGQATAMLRIVQESLTNVQARQGIERRSDPRQARRRNHAHRPR